VTKIGLLTRDPLRSRSLLLQFVMILRGPPPLETSLGDRFAVGVAAAGEAGRDCSGVSFWLEQVWSIEAAFPDADLLPIRLLFLIRFKNGILVPKHEYGYVVGAWRDRAIGIA